MPATFSFALSVLPNHRTPTITGNGIVCWMRAFTKHVLKTGYSQSCTPDAGTAWGMLLPPLQLTLSFPENTS